MKNLIALALLLTIAFSITRVPVNKQELSDEEKLQYFYSLGGLDQDTRKIVEAFIPH